MGCLSLWEFDAVESKMADVRSSCADVVEVKIKKREPKPLL
jgi:hypothetical protein